MATRSGKSPTLEDIEERIEPDLKSGFPDRDLTDEDTFNTAYDEYFEDKPEILYSQRTRQRVYNVHRERKKRDIKSLKDKHGISHTRHQRKNGTYYYRYRRQGKFISKQDLDNYSKKNIK